MKKDIITLLLFALLLFSSFFQPARKTLQDYRRLTGAAWTGQLTYVDYSSGKRTAIKANLQVFQSVTDPYVFYRKYAYPDEPGANSTDTIVISRDGKSIGAERIVQRRKQKDTIYLVTEKRSFDSGKEMLFRYTYRISSKEFTIRKDERTPADTAYMERNTYTFLRP